MEPPARAISCSEFSTVCGLFLTRVGAVAAGFETDAIDGAVNNRLAEDLVDGTRQVAGLAEVDDFATEALGLGQTLGNHVADDDHRGSEQLRTGGGGETDGTRARDVDGGTGLDAGLHTTVETSRENVGQKSQVLDLRKGLFFIRELD